MEIQNLNYERNMDKSYFLVIGDTGVGKSSFINALIKEERCSVGNKCTLETKEVQMVNFIYNNHQYVAVDTPCLKGEDLDSEIIVDKLEHFFKKIPKIKSILIVMTYNTFRLTRSLTEAIFLFMKIFPIKDFWNHVIIIYSFCNPENIAFSKFMKQNNITFYEKVASHDKITLFMKEKKIIFPSSIKEFYVDSFEGENIKEIQDTFKDIKEYIHKMENMFNKYY